MTPEEDAEDLATLLRETRGMQGVSAWELARRAGVSTEDVLAFEAARVIPADEPFAVYMRALGYDT
jgi:ribosome-binding protein aMBF1 (putative translation factor)